MNDLQLSRLRALCAGVSPRPASSSMQQMAGQVVDRVLRHLDTLADQSIGRTATAVELASLLNEPPPEEGRDFGDLLKRFDEEIAPFSCRINHPRFLAFVPAAPTLEAILGDWLCAGYNFFAGVWLESSSCAAVEMTVLNWFRGMLHMPTSTRGILTSGGSEANLTALVVARDRLPSTQRHRAVLYTSRQRHWSIDRAAFVAGFLPEQIRLLDTDTQYRVQIGQLRQSIQSDRAEGRIPWLVVAHAGATSTGTVDPLVEMATLCQQENLWFHIDAAYGWAAALDLAGSQILRGIDRADSITLDPHKWFAQPYEVGCLLVRDGSLLRQTFAIRPEYLQDVVPEENQINFCDHGIALTRRFRALKVWLSVHALGLNWFRRNVSHCLALAQYAEALLRVRGFEILNPASLSVVCFRAVRQDYSATQLDELNRHLAEAIRDSQQAFIATTQVDKRVSLRLCFVNCQTSADDIDQVVDLLCRLAQG